jgi:hypothetical protein
MQSSGYVAAWYHDHCLEMILQNKLIPYMYAPPCELTTVSSYHGLGRCMQASVVSSELLKAELQPVVQATGGVWITNPLGLIQVSRGTH